MASAVLRPVIEGTPLQEGALSSVGTHGVHVLRPRGRSDVHVACSPGACGDEATYTSLDPRYRRGPYRRPASSTFT